MMAATQRGAHPFAPLVLDDAGSLEAMAAAVMRLHSTLMTVGRCYTTDATGGRAALELGRVESVFAGAFCTIFGQSPADRFADIFDQVTYVAEHMVKDHRDSYPIPPIFAKLAKEGEIEEQMMYNTFNMGLGMVLAVDPADVDKTMDAIREAGDQPYVVGKIEAGEKGVTLC